MNLLVAQFTTDRSEDTSALRFTAGAENDGGVLVELDVGTVGTAGFLDGADDDGLDHVALLDRPARDGVLDGGDDHVADAGIASLRSAEHADGEEFLRTRVVGDMKPRFLLNH